MNIHLAYQKSLKNKFGAIKKDGFDSTKEYMRNIDLIDLEKRGVIQNLKTQVVFPIKINGVLITKYIADFCYVMDGKNIIEDVKGGVKSATFVIKQKLLKVLYDIDITIH